MPEEKINLTGRGLWQAGKTWWSALHAWMRIMVLVGVIAGAGALVAALVGTQNNVASSVIKDGRLYLYPAGGTFDPDVDMPVTIRVGNPSGQNIGAVTAVVTFNPIYLSLEARECQTATDSGCVNVVHGVGSSFTKPIPSAPGFTVTRNSATQSTFTISRGMESGWFTDTDGVVAILQFRTSPGNKGKTKVDIALSTSTIGVPRDTGNNVCYEGYNSGVSCAVREQNHRGCLRHDPVILQCGQNSIIQAPSPIAARMEEFGIIHPAEAQTAIVGVCAPPSRVPNCVAASDCQEFNQCGAEFITEDILDSANPGSVQGGEYTIGGLSCTELGGVDECVSGGKVCAGGVNSGNVCLTSNDCPRYGAADLVNACKPGGNCTTNINRLCEDDAACQEYDACVSGQGGEICSGVVYNDIEPSTICCSKACETAQGGQLYIQNPSAMTESFSGSSGTEYISWTVFPPAAGHTQCTITFPGSGIASQTTNAQSFHEVRTPLSTAGTFNYSIECAAQGYTKAQYSGSFTVNNPGGGLLALSPPPQVPRATITSTQAQVLYGTTIPALGTVTLQRVSCTIPGFPAYTSTINDTTPVLTHRHIISFPAYAGACTYSVRVTATGSGQTVTATAQFTASVQAGLAPDANIIMKVTKDRVCKKWLFCQSAVKVEGEKQPLCFDLGACDTLDADGQCINPVEPGSSELTFPTPAQVRTIKEMSGMAKAGLDWGGSPREIIRGYYPYPGMYETGKNVKVQNGSFESGEEAPWRAIPSNSGGSIEAFPNTADRNNPSSILRVSPGNISWTGAAVPLGIVYASADPFVVTFRARADTGGSKNIKVQLAIGSPPTHYTFGSFAEPPVTEVALFSSWKLYQLRLVSPNKSGNASLQFVQSEPRSISDGAFYLDDVAIQPVLEVAGQSGQLSRILIPRSCRLYPKPGAPACDFLEEVSGKEYVGWKGYCVERQDPDPLRLNDPQNPCLLWWPVDVLAGNADLFTGEARAGYTGRKPLYYCLESKGDWPYHERVLHGGVNTGQTDHVLWAFDASGLDIHRDEVLEIRVNGIQIDHDGGSTGDCQLAVENPSGTNQAIVSGNTGTLYLNANNKAHWSDAFGANKSCSGAQRDAEYNPHAWLRCANRGSANDCNTVSARAVFNSRGILQEVQVRYIDGVNAGAAKADSVTVTYRGERCNVLAQVVTPEGDAVPWTSRFTSREWADNPAGYPYLQDYEPYGGAVPPAGDTIDPGSPDTWQGAAYVEAPLTSIGQQKPYQYRAGSPYGAARSNTQCYSTGRCTLNYVDGNRLQDHCSNEVTLKCDETTNGDKECIRVPYSCAGDVPQGAGQVCITGSSDRLGKACSSTNGCGFVNDGANAPGICAGITNPPGTDWTQFYNNISGGAVAGRNNIGRLFIKSYGVWKWTFDPASQSYTYMKCSDSTDGMAADNTTPLPGCITSWDFTGDARNAPSAPQVLKIEVDAPLVMKHAADVTLRFTSTIDPNHVPLTGFRIDWGDGSPITEVAGLRINARSSMEDPHTAVHTYTCGDVVDCVYKPAVQVTDNWGWCNGGGHGVACAETLAANPNSIMWTKYSGEIRVQP